jgi:tetratricopeptide (TPR) repeat protein
MSSADTKAHKTGPARLLTDEDVSALEAFDEGYEAYFGKMIDYLDKFVEQGIKEGRFTEQQAAEDLELSLWYGFAYNNLDIYPAYYRSLEIMKPAEKNAKGCGAWYYRYSIALTYCGKPAEAMEYAEKAVTEEPTYPWGWLQAAKLRYHFGSTEGALQAIEEGLKLVPDDYEFLTLRKEIGLGYTLEQLEYHWIGPEQDKKLQAGLDKDADSPFCHGLIELNNIKFRVMFRMNEAAMSKLNFDWLAAQKDIIAMHYLQRPCGSGICQLVLVVFNLDYSITLVYYDPAKDRHYEISTPKEGALDSPVMLNMEFPDEEIDNNSLN